MKKVLDKRSKMWYNYINPPSHPKERKLATANRNQRQKNRMFHVKHSIKIIRLKSKCLKLIKQFVKHTY